MSCLNQDWSDSWDFAAPCSFETQWQSMDSFPWEACTKISGPSWVLKSRWVGTPCKKCWMLASDLISLSFYQASQWKAAFHTIPSKFPVLFMESLFWHPASSGSFLVIPGTRLQHISWSNFECIKNTPAARTTRGTILASSRIACVWLQFVRGQRNGRSAERIWWRGFL